MEKSKWLGTEEGQAGKEPATQNRVSQSCSHSPLDERENTAGQGMRACP